MQLLCKVTYNVWKRPEYSRWSATSWMFTTISSVSQSPKYSPSASNNHSCMLVRFLLLIAFGSCILDVFLLYFILWLVLLLCILITMNNIQLRWWLGYIILRMVVSSGIHEKASGNNRLWYRYHVWKKELQEIEKRWYKFVYPKSILLLDSIET